MDGRKIVARYGAWALYWLGSLVCLAMGRLAAWRLLPLYQKLMGGSYKIQAWGGIDGPWLYRGGPPSH